MTTVLCLGGPCRVFGSSSPRFKVATVDHFFDTGEWPTEKLLQKELTQLGDPADARREARRLPYGHGHRENGQVVLSVRGIFDARPNHPLLDDFERALKLVVRLYERGAKRMEATLSHRTLIGRHSFSDSQASRTIALLESEGLVADAGYGADIKVVLPRIREFLRVRDVEDYVEKKKALDRRRRIRGLLRRPLDLWRWFGSEETSLFKKIIVGVLTLVLATLLIGAILGYGLQQDSAGGNHAPSKSAAARSGG